MATKTKSLNNVELHDVVALHESGNEQHASACSACIRGTKEELRHVSVCVSTFSILLEGFRRFHSVYATTFPADVSSMYASPTQAPEASPHRQHQPNQRRPRRTKAEAWDGHWNGRWTNEHRVQTDRLRWWMDWWINLIHAQGESQETIECSFFDTRVHAWARHVLLQVAPKNLQAVGGICSRVADCRLSRWCWILQKLSFFWTSTWHQSCVPACHSAGCDLGSFGHQTSQWVSPWQVTAESSCDMLHDWRIMLCFL